MDDSTKHASSYQLDQEILDARGIDLTVEEVAWLPTCKYAERLQALKLNESDLAFLKGLRRRIKNRLASQNSRRRSLEHLRRLTRELRAVRARRNKALAERRVLLTQRDTVRTHCHRLRQHLVQVLKERSDSTEVPSIDPEIETDESHDTKENSITSETETELLDCYKEQRIERDKNIFECRIDKLVQQSVNHMFNKKKVYAKTVFIKNEKYSSNIKSMVYETDLNVKVLGKEEGVLNLSVKEGRRRSHGRKQSAPRRIAYENFDTDDAVLDLKIKKEQ